jgi:hypothetical protein
MRKGREASPRASAARGEGGGKGTGEGGGRVSPEALVGSVAGKKPVFFQPLIRLIQYVASIGD